MKNFIVNNTWVIALICAMTMLMAHTFSFDFVKVDNTSIILLVVICISPFISAITKIKMGEFEAEINPDEVKKIKENVSKQVSNSNENDKPTAIVDTVNSIIDLSENDHILALAKLRIEIEKLLAKLYRVTRKGQMDRKFTPVGVLTRILSEEEILPLDITRSIQEVVSICNRAIHGEDIRKEDAMSVVETGGDLVFEIDYYISTTMTKASEVFTITREESDRFRDALYKVTTVIPLLENPKINVRFLTQEGLDELLNGYEDYAEFLTGIEIVNDESRHNTPV